MTQQNLKNSLNKLFKLNLTPIIGIELELYLTKNNSQINKNNPSIDQFISDLTIESKSKNISLINIEKEQGEGQIEVKTTPYCDIPKLCHDTMQLKELSKQIAKKLSLEATFTAQPFRDDCGSALQINLSLLNSQNMNVFAKKEEESDILLFSIGGILESLKDNMSVYAPKAEDLLRYDPQTNINLFKKGKYPAPINISWGYNNRTTAIRIPSDQGKERRLEFRVPASNANITEVVIRILESVKNGVENKTKTTEPIYGNAFDSEYLLKINS